MTIKSPSECFASSHEAPWLPQNFGSGLSRSLQRFDAELFRDAAELLDRIGNAFGDFFRRAWRGLGA
jgi:hypothetical protein